MFMPEVVISAQTHRTACAVPLKWKRLGASPPVSHRGSILHSPDGLRRAAKLKAEGRKPFGEATTGRSSLTGRLAPCR